MSQVSIGTLGAIAARTYGGKLGEGTFDLAWATVLIADSIQKLIEYKNRVRFMEADSALRGWTCKRDLQEFERLIKRRIVGDLIGATYNIFAPTVFDLGKAKSEAFMRGAGRIKKNVFQYINPSSGKVIAQTPFPDFSLVVTLAGKVLDRIKTDQKMDFAVKFLLQLTKRLRNLQDNPIIDQAMIANDLY